MPVFSVFLRAALLFALVALHSIDAAATCSATTQDDLSVGDTSTDAACNYDTIQDAINAASCPAGTRIHITNEHTYTAQHLTITNKNVSLIGRAVGSHCGGLEILCGFLFPCPTAPLASISGNGHSGDSVVTIRGASNVSLQYLTIIGGRDSDSGAGGGIDYAGTGTLTLDTSTVTGNSAGYGGGINVNGSGGSMELHLLKNTLITANTATASGGGIRVEGNARLFALAPQIAIAFNHADAGFGGGIEVIEPGQVDIGSPGYSGLPVIYSNEALRGGGIAVAGGGIARLFTTDPLSPVSVNSNVAINTGGGIYVSRNGGGSVCAFDFRIDANIAQEGSAIYSDVNGADEGGAAYLNSNPHNSCTYPESTVTLGGVACDASVACNTIHANIAEMVNNNGQPTTGAAILMQSGSEFIASRFDVRDNHGGSVLRIVGNASTPEFYTSASLNNCVIANNVVSAELIRSGDGTSHLDISNCTFANDQIGGAHVFSANDVFALHDSIVDEGAVATLAFSGSAGNLAVQYDIADNTAGLPADPTIIAAAPTFMDAAHGDYRLRYSRQGGVVTYSAGLDYAPPVGGDDRDIRNLPHDQDLPGIGDIGGNRDIGAYEMQPFADRIFADPFGDVLLLAY